MDRLISQSSIDKLVIEVTDGQHYVRQHAKIQVEFNYGLDSILFSDSFKFISIDETDQINSPIAQFKIINYNDNLLCQHSLFTTNTIKYYFGVKIDKTSKSCVIFNKHPLKWSKSMQSNQYNFSIYLFSDISLDPIFISLLSININLVNQGYPQFNQTKYCFMHQLPLSPNYLIGQVFSSNNAQIAGISYSLLSSNEGFHILILILIMSQ